MWLHRNSSDCIYMALAACVRVYLHTVAVSMIWLGHECRDCSEAFSEGFGSMSGKKDTHRHAATLDLHEHMSLLYCYGNYNPAHANRD